MLRSIDKKNRGVITVATGGLHLRESEATSFMVLFCVRVLLG